MDATAWTGGGTAVAILAAFGLLYRGLCAAESGIKRRTRYDRASAE